jgi:superfamily II DNA or RNA helicase
MPAALRLTFTQGSLVLDGPWPQGALSAVCRWDARVDRYRAPAHARRLILQECARRGLAVEDRACQAQSLALTLRLAFVPHPYQEEAVAAWRAAGGCGTVILPTGAGKSYVALRVLAAVKRSALIVVPTLDLLAQWRTLLAATFGEPIGCLGGGTHELCALTVATYESAYLHLPHYGDRFELLIFDEVHHLPAPRYREIPALAVARFRLGLTATYARPDGAHRALEFLVGPVVYRVAIAELAGRELADYELVRVRVHLSVEEAQRYAEVLAVYQDGCRRAGIVPKGQGWAELVRRSASDPGARTAIEARQALRYLVAEARGKADLLEALLWRHSAEKVLIFTDFTAEAYRLAAEFLLPVITHETAPHERRWILDGFRGTRFNRLVTARVLNEGVDVPAAKVGIILGGTASPREYVQRLGRLLRKGDGTRAVLYEVVVAATTEVQTSARRRQTDAYT